MIAIDDELNIPPEVAMRLGYYVYVYVDPRDKSIFYVGKGKDERALAHLSEEAESRKCARIAELRAAGTKPQIDILAHGLKDEEAAFRIEAAVIDALGLEKLTNEVRGWQSLERGRIPLSELTIYYAAKPVDVKVPALLIRINRLYRHNMPEHELYEATRGDWKVGDRCRKARYAFAVFEGVVREVYEIDSWHDAADAEYTTRETSPARRDRRRAFMGHVATDIRDEYVGRSVAKSFKRGMQSPVVYVNC